MRFFFFGESVWVGEYDMIIFSLFCILVFGLRFLFRILL